MAGAAETMNLDTDGGRQKRAPTGRRWARAGLLLAAAAVVLAACSSSPDANSQHVASLGTSSAGAGATTEPASGNSGSGQSSAGNSSAALQFSQCMRAHGVSGFPDPSSGGGYSFNVGAVNANSPTFRAAQRTCQKSVGAGTPTGQVLTQDVDHLLRYARCMRSHGVISFPDPVVRSGLPPGFDFPPNMDVTSPAFLAADNVCHSLLPHGGDGHGP